MVNEVHTVPILRISTSRLKNINNSLKDYMAKKCDSESSWIDFKPRISPQFYLKRDVSLDPQK